MDNRPIGIFDSGVGGLTVVKEFLKETPNEEIIYFGDTARVPYGSKSREIVTKYSMQIVNFLISKNVKAIVIACHTVSSNSYDELKNTFDIPIIEVVSSGVEDCLNTTKNNIVGVIGTERTISSGSYERYIKAVNPNITVYSKACPLFAPLAEEGWVNNHISEATAKAYLTELINKNIDSLLLGCTHYPLLMETIKKTVGDIAVINPARTTALKMKALLSKMDLNCAPGRIAEHTFYVSDNTGKFNEICSLVFNRIYNAQKVDIEVY